MLMRDIKFGGRIDVGSTSILVEAKTQDVAVFSVDGKLHHQPFDKILTLMDSASGQEFTIQPQKKAGKIVRLGITAPSNVKIIQVTR